MCDNATFCLITVNCGRPRPPANGFIEAYENTTEGVEIFFRCNTEFVPAQRMRAVCTSDGGWSPDPTALECNGEMNCFSMQISTMLKYPMRVASAYKALDCELNGLAWNIFQMHSIHPQKLKRRFHFTSFRGTLSHRSQEIQSYND